jgi:hypothetical protein
VLLFRPSPLTSHALSLFSVPLLLPQELYSALSPRGFSILAFPCDCFGNQEPGSDAEIAAFASNKYGVTFPLFSKIGNVNGDDAHPIFDWLKLQPGMDGDISWNFNKARSLTDSLTAFECKLNKGLHGCGFLTRARYAVPDRAQRQAREALRAGVERRDHAARRGGAAEASVRRGGRVLIGRWSE